MQRFPFESNNFEKNGIFGKSGEFCHHSPQNSSEMAEGFANALHSSGQISRLVERFYYSIEC